jgi:sigma-E factor negative regulatory protein RseB
VNIFISRLFVVFLSAGFFAVTGPASADAAESPHDWLQRMTVAMAETDFEGTVVRRQNGESEALKLVHKLVDGVVNERIVSQEGNGLEIIRVGNEVHCIVPDSKSVLIEHWNEQTTILPAIPGDTVNIGPQYHLSVVREERVAGRKAVLLAIRPSDEFRFGHRFWLDTETAFPLRAELMDSDGVLLEQIKFADIRLGSSVSAAALESTLDLDGYTWYTDRVRPEAEPVETDWTCDDLPAGFRIMSSEIEQLPGSEARVTHIVYGDGLATVSVFIAEKHSQSPARRSIIGATHSFTANAGEHQVTVVGEVPAVTVERIALSMHLQ